MEKIFGKGFNAKRNEKAPDFHICRLSVKIEDAIPFLQEHVKNGYVNLNVTKARSGSLYVELDTFEPKKEEATTSKEEKGSEDLPF